MEVCRSTWNEYTGSKEVRWSNDRYLLMSSFDAKNNGVKPSALLIAIYLPPSNNEKSNYYMATDTDRFSGNLIG